MLTLLWFGRDLRLTDNPALAAAIARGGAIVPIFILDDIDAGEWVPGGASRWWLHGSLRTLDDSLRQRGSTLVLRRGSAEIVINQLLVQTGADAVYWNHRYEPWATARGERLKRALISRGIEVQSFNSALIREPWTVTTQKGEPYRVFTPFWKALKATGVSESAAAAPKRILGPETFPQSEPLSSFSLRPTAPDWAGGMEAMWTPGEAGAQTRTRRVCRRRGVRLSRQEKHARRGRHLAIVASSPLWRNRPASDLAFDHGPGLGQHWQSNAERCRDLSLGDRLAGVFLSPAVPFPELCQRRRSARSSPSSLGQRTPKDFRLGSADSQAIQSSMLGCGSCGAQDGCTTACE